MTIQQPHYSSAWSVRHYFHFCGLKFSPVLIASRRFRPSAIQQHDSGLGRNHIIKKFSYSA